MPFHNSLLINSPNKFTTTLPLCRSKNIRFICSLSQCVRHIYIRFCLLFASNNYTTRPGLASGFAR